MANHIIASIAGDGIGQELVPGVASLVDMAVRAHGDTINWQELDWSSSRYLETGRFMPVDWLELITAVDAVFLGAVGDLRVPDHVSLWGLLLPIRRGLRQSVNLRPILTLPGVRGPLRDERPFDVLIVRENNEGEYADVGGSVYADTADEVVVQSSVFTRRGTEQVIRYAFEQARQRGGRLVSATKSNGLVFSMPFWDKVARETAGDFPDIEFHEMHVDALAARLVLEPTDFDVIVGSNLFGDILSDLGAALMGGIGLAASANVNPRGDAPSMFEPVHGSAPDIVGRGVANPTGQILSGVLMLEHLGLHSAAVDLREALWRVTADPRCRTPDVGGTATTIQVLSCMVDELEQPSFQPTDYARRT